MITIKAKGNFSKSYKFFEKCKEIVKLGDFDKYGKRGVEALKNATPIDTGKTADSWNYEIEHTSKGVNLIWTNSNQNEGVPIAIILQYGHATGSGVFVQGIDYINPALKPVFESIADEVWKEVEK